MIKGNGQERTAGRRRRSLWSSIARASLRPVRKRPTPQLNTHAQRQAFAREDVNTARARLPDPLSCTRRMLCGVNSAPCCGGGRSRRAYWTSYSERASIATSLFSSSAFGGEQSLLKRGARSSACCLTCSRVINSRDVSEGGKNQGSCARS